MKKLFLTAVLLAIPGVAAAQAVTGRQYVAMAGAGDQYEVQSSRLVLATTRNPALRRFAGMMVHDHTDSTAKVKHAAMLGHVMAGPPHLDADGARNIAELRRARGAARDALYIEQQKAAHQKALDLHQGYAANGDVPSLTRVAATIVPVVQHHIGELSRM